MQDCRHKELCAFSLAAVKDFDLDLSEAPWSAEANAGGDIGERTMMPVETSSGSIVNEDNRRDHALVSQKVVSESRWTFRSHINCRRR